MNRKQFFSLTLLFVILAAAQGACETVDPILPDRETLSEVTLYRVIDGDTIVFESNKILLTVRMIGINAPESGTPYARNASEYLEDCLKDARIFIEKGEEQLDDYGRLLAYVWLGDGTLLNLCALRDGTAAICFFPPNLKYAAAFAEAQVFAIHENKGLWAVYGKSDGSFPSDEIQYIGNINSRALHKTYCASLPAEKNRVYFTSYEEAIQNGYHECRNCFQ